MEMSPPAAMASIKALVPDLAMVPKLLMSSFLVMPMPESSMVKVEFVLSGTILGCFQIKSNSPDSREEGEN